MTLEAPVLGRLLLPAALLLSACQPLPPLQEPLPATETPPESPLPAAQSPAAAAPRAHRPAANPPYRQNRENLDLRNPAFAVLQPPVAAMGDFPTDSTGQIDWVETLARDLITPRSSLDGVTGGMTYLDLEIVMEETREMPHVRFPHRAHSEWLTCGSCHPKPFQARRGANAISMDDIFRGRWCGLCHGRVAFSVLNCERCHDLVHEGSPGRWW